MKYPEDNGKYVTDSRGRVVGKRGYHRSQTDPDGPLIPTTEHPDGSTTTHYGGPCGDGYTDRNGES